MPSTTLHIPTLVSPVSGNGKTEYFVRPLFNGQPAVSHRLYQEAMVKYKGELKRMFSAYVFSRSKASQLLWYKLSSNVSLHHYSFSFEVGSRRVDGRFAVAGFELRGNTYALLPAFGNFTFMVPKNAKGKADLKGQSEQVIAKILKKFLKEQGENFDPAGFYASKKEFLTTVSHNIVYKEGGFSFEEDYNSPFLSLRKEGEFDGAEEMEKTGSYDLCTLYPQGLRRAHFKKSEADRLYPLIFSGENTPLVLVGESGAGRHTLVEEAVWRYVHNDGQEREYSKRRGIWLVYPNRIIAGMSVVGFWEKRFEAMLRFLEEPVGRPGFQDILLIDNPVALLHIGKTAQNNLTLSHALKPWLENRRLQVVLIATPEEWKILQERQRSFAELFQVFRLSGTDIPTAIKMVLLRRKALETEHECRITIPAVVELFTIHQNFFRNRALPGNVMKILGQMAARYRGQRVDASEVREEFKSFSGLQEAFFDEQARLEDDDLRKMLELELVGQPAAVEALAGAIHQIKAKLTDRNRPLASFLFTGPTGVGKTQAAKLLCKILLGSEERLLRFDMNEYFDGGALHRLIGDAWNPEGQLTGRVRYQPFGVLLLDEIEKAHPAIHDLLLQVLDDARLADSLGRTVDFSNTIIVMTSNLGAAEAGSTLGFGRERQDESGIFLKAIASFFRPEFVNRIGQTVVFHPLTFAEIQKIAQIQIRELLQREGFVRRTTIVNVSPEALDWVARRGFDAKMGGRALKRQIERDLTLLSAEQLVRTAANIPIILEIFLENDRLVPRITPLDFAQPNEEGWLPEIPNENAAGKFFHKLQVLLENIERSIGAFERRKQKAAHLFNLGQRDSDWQHYDFKNKVAEAKERFQFKRLRMRDRRIQSAPALPLRIKSSVLVPRRVSGSKAERENLRDLLFQQEALQELREEHCHASLLFDSFQTAFLDSFLEIAFLRLLLKGFLLEQTDRVTLRFESIVAHSGNDEINWLMQLYERFFKKMDIHHEVFPDRQTIEAEGHSLFDILKGEEGIHLFYLANRVALPVRIKVSCEGKVPVLTTHQVIRVYDAETVTDLRTGYSSDANLTPSEFKLLLYGGLESADRIG